MFGSCSRAYATAISEDSTIRFCTSWLLSPLAFAIWRALVSLYAFVVIFVILGHTSGTVYPGRSFSYFTVLGYWGLAFYYAFAAVHAGSFWYRGGRSFLSWWPRWMRWAHGCFYSSVTTFPFVVTIVFWGLLSNGALSTEFSTWSNISEHALNSVFAFLDLILSRANPSPWINLPVVIVLLALYLALAEITHATQGWWVYDFLDPNWHGRGVLAGACVGILVATAIIFVIFRYVGLFRKWLTEDVCGAHGNFSTRGGRQVQPYTGQQDGAGDGVSGYDRDHMGGGMRVEGESEGRGEVIDLQVLEPKSGGESYQQQQGSGARKRSVGAGVMEV